MYFLFHQVPHHQGHLAPVPRDPASQRGRKVKDGGQGRREKQLQAFPPGPESGGRGIFFFFSSKEN